MTYHIVAASFSNVIWFLTMRQLVISDLTMILLLPYTVGTVAGSILGVKIAMVIEKLIGATADGHIKK